MAFCSSCGAQLPEGARFCPACGATVADGTAQTAAPPPAAPVLPADTIVTPPTSGGGGARLILPIIIVIAIVVIAFVFLTQREGARPIAGEKSVTGDVAAKTGPAETERTAEPAEPRSEDVSATADDSDSVTSTTAASLDSAFFTDPDGAAARYAGPVRVSGTIATMVTPGPTPALSLEGRTRFNYMIVNFPTGYRQRLASLSKGERITVECPRVTSLGGTTILQGCALK